MLELGVGNGNQAKVWLDQFRLMDQKMAHLFEDGDMYLLVVDFLPQNPDSDDQFIDLDQAEMGHA